jgi:hypothetical protein
MVTGLQRRLRVIGWWGAGENGLGKLDFELWLQLAESSKEKTPPLRSLQL